MKVLLVFAHPEPRSLSAALRDVAVRELEAQGHEVRVSDLYAMNWKSEVDRADFPPLAADARLMVTAASRDAFHAPAWAKAIAIARPIPLPAPVIKAVLSENCRFDMQALAVQR